VRRSRRTWWAALLVLLVGCQSASPPASIPPTQPARPAVTTVPPSAPSAATLASPAASAMPAPLSPPVAVHVGVLSSISDSGIYIGVAKGYYRELGLDVQVDTISDPNTIGTLVNTNQLDVGGYGVNTNPFLAAARGIGVKMVADKATLRPGFEGFVALVARKELLDSGQIRTWADLRGRKLAKLAPCDSNEPNVEKALERGGLTRDDVEIVYMAFPDMVPALANGAVDAAVLLEPFIAVAKERGIAGPIPGTDELYPNQQVATLYYSPDFAQRTEAARRFMIGYLRAVRDYNDAFTKGVGRAEVVQILAQNTPVKDVALYDKLVPAGLDPDGRLNVAGIRDDVALWTRIGCTQGEVADVRQVIDESFAQYAVGVLGPYH
jgi:ABC-type nitrate/sulfonate/bicarbonate transport system substrate-binding protein